MHLRHKPHHQTGHTAGRLAVEITEIRPGDLRRDENTHPETVVHYRPLSPDISREYAQIRAALIAAGFAPGALDRYRVKVVAR